MKTVWKFPFPAVDEFSLNMPCGAQILHVAMQGHQPTLWALVDDKALTEERRFRFAGTGHPLDDLRGGERYVGTILARSDLVFHLFEEAKS
jgi:hypothetical protein